MSVFEKQVYVPAELLQALGEHTGHFWSSPALDPIICDAIRTWMKPAPIAQQQPAAPSGLPDSQAWLLADVCRAAQKTAIARLFGGDAPASQSVASQFVAPVSGPRQNKVRPSGAPQAAHGNIVPRKQGSGRAARRKRRASKPLPGNR